MESRPFIRRRDFLQAGAAATGALLLGTPGPGAAEPPGPSRANDARRGIVHVIVFSNFEGWPVDPEPAVKWFEDCSRAHAPVLWTHMYSPWHLLVKSPDARKAESGFSPYLMEVQAKTRAEIGLHIHMDYELMKQIGVGVRAHPYASDKSADCNHPRRIEDDRGKGYDVLMTGYTEHERSTILDVSIGAFLGRGFGRPTAFCAGYSATDPALQALLVEKGFTVSFAAQAISPDQYGGCWDKLLEWSRRITPLTIPYRVSRTSILPPPHRNQEHLELVEVPLNLGVDAYDLYWEKNVVTRAEMFDRHFRWAGATGNETVVAIGVHAEVIAREVWGAGPVFKVIDGFLKHLRQRATEGGAEIRFGTVSDVARRFRDNTLIGQVPS